MKIIKKKLNILLTVIILFLLMLFIVRIIATLKYYYYLETRPCNQENTTWSSEDGKILLYVDKGNNAKIYFEQSNTFIQCYFVSDRGYYASVYSWEAFENDRLGLYQDEHYETWNYLIVKKDTFTVTIEKTTFLNVGDTITFNKVS